MQEIAEIPKNGLKVISTFSGCGGSCLGYRMAGFEVIWANEFVPSAQITYRSNADPASILDKRDIRNVKPEEILAATKLKKTELDIFDGSPPCQAFSMCGDRQKGWGKTKVYEHGAQQCNETLFDEYIRLLKGLKPKVFIAENVNGLVKGVAKGFFLEILKALKAEGYRVSCRLLDAQWLGVPQRRKRVIFIGVRNDLNQEPVFPKPLPYYYSVKDACPWIEKIAGSISYTDFKNRNHKPRFINSDHPSGTIIAAPHLGNGLCLGPKVLEQWEQTHIGKSSPKYWQLIKADLRKPSPTITGPNGVGITLPNEPRRFTITELKRICSFPDDFSLIGSYHQQWERLGNSVPPLMMKAVSECIRDKILLNGK